MSVSSVLRRIPDIGVGLTEFLRRPRAYASNWKARADPVPSKEVLGWCLAASFLLLSFYKLAFGPISLVKAMDLPLPAVSNTEKTPTTRPTIEHIGWHLGFGIGVDFLGGELCSEGGLMLLRQVDRHTGSTRQAAAALDDARQSGKVRHSLRSLIAQRLYALCWGYEDLNDHDTLRLDSVMQTALDRDQVLASAPTLCRLENTAVISTLVTCSPRPPSSP